MKKIIALFLILIFSGCMATHSVEKSNLTPGMVKKEIVSGVTSQTEVLNVFGPPNIITKNKSGNEVWTYDKISMDDSSSRMGAGVGGGGLPGPAIVGAALSGSSSSRSTSSRTFTLMIEFDESDVVKEFSYRSSEF